MIIKKLLYLIVFIFLLSINVHSQENRDCKIIILHKLVGDTIDQRGKIKFKLFPEISHLDFEFALYLTCYNGASLRVFKNDSSFYEIERSSEEYFADVQTVIANRNREYVEPVTDFKYILVTLTDLDSNRTLKLKKGKKNILYAQRWHRL